MSIFWSAAQNIQYSVPESLPVTVTIRIVLDHLDYLVSILDHGAGQPVILHIYLACPGLGYIFPLPAME